MRLLHWLHSFFPTQLPIGAEEHDKWASSIVALAGKGVPDNSSTRFALAVMIMHLGGQTSHKPKRFFVKSLLKASANEVAHATAQKYKLEQEEAKKREADAAKAELKAAD